MSEATNRRDFLVKTAAVVAAGSSVVACGNGGDHELPIPAQFRYGVASGDPLTDRGCCGRMPKSRAAMPPCR